MKKHTYYALMLTKQVIKNWVIIRIEQNVIFTLLHQHTQLVLGLLLNGIIIIRVLCLVWCNSVKEGCDKHAFLCTLNISYTEAFVAIFLYVLSNRLLIRGIKKRIVENMQRGREGTVKVRKLEDVMMDDKVAKNVASRKKGGKGFINLPEYVESYEFNDGVFTVTIPTGEKLFVVGGKFMREFISLPSNMFNKSRIFFFGLSRYYAVCLEDEAGKYKRYGMLFSYFISKIDLPESIDTSQDVIARIINYEVSKYIKNKDTGAAIFNVEGMLRNIVFYTLLFRFFGEIGITNKKLVQTIKGFVSDPAISSNYNWTKEAFFKYKFIRGNYLTKYLETAVMLRTNHPKHTLPRDLVQFLASNKEWFDHKDAHIISYSLLLVIRSGVYLSTVKLHSVLTELSLRKDVLLELRKEQEDIMSKYGSDLKYAHLDQMIYLDAFIKEVFRLSASAKNLLRRATADITLSNGVVIPKGGYSTFNMHSYNRMHSLFGKNSTEFDYKRHVRAGASLSDCSPYNLVWSAGPRICVAREYAVAISKTIMAILIRNYSIENLLKPPKGCEYTPLDFKLGSFGLYLERLNGQKNKSKHKTKGVTRQNRVIFEE